MKGGDQRSLELDFRSLGARVAAHQDAQRAQPAELWAIRQRVLSTPERDRKGGARWVFALAAFSALSLAGVCWLHWQRPPPNLSFLVGEGGLPGAPVGATIAADELQPLQLSFSDGSTLKLAPRASGRVAALNAAGARIELERGQAAVHVNPRSGARWQFNAGPFLVDVTGTDFNLAWSPQERRLLLAMKEGTVKVSGCGLGQGRALRAPETLDVSCPVEAAGRVASVPETSEPPAAAPRPAPAPDLGVRQGATEAHWQLLARQGKYEAAYASVMERGLAVELQSAKGKELMLLGDICRYTGHVAQASDAYRAVRSRFPGTSEASAAVFALGRIAFDQRGAYAEAVPLFARYLQERPSGPFASEARVRLVEALHRSGDAAGARAAARDYLRHHPTGAYAAQARQLLAQ